MKTDISKNGDITIIKIKVKNVDASNASALKDVVKDQVAKGDKKFILDLSEVEFIDTLGISTLLSIVKLAESSEQVCFANATGQVLNVFKITNLKSLLQFQPSVEDALKHFHSKAESKKVKV